ncbi:glycoside hydrolase family 2 protein [Mucilaginibacter robiniae]|uniref:Glycoside hydrolase family 2 protein n=1 Tax=Mucilaginibacter robiniae TaxID=2728022 RepID=A0A7L5E3Z6_9SPHI|nr:glycoside hydrolase family 2 TIM barrel-domain containing protein [Mucilaginibacter robiniae]QJD96999.1 glycoside hydrolase family 2 protein [Mucilaginibacter robiniae]
MKNYIACFLGILGTAFSARAQYTPPSVTNFNQNWQFVKDLDTSQAAQRLSTATSIKISWQNVALPHTPQLEPIQKVKEQWQGTCYYRKTFTVPTANKGRRMVIQFDAAMHEADVYLNGKHLFKHLGGYLPFVVDVSDAVKFNQPNYLLVKLNNQDNADIPPGKPIKDLDFNYYGGLYRNAWLITRNKLYISDAVQENREAGGGILIHDDNVSKESASLGVKVEVRNQYATAQQASIVLILKDVAGQTVATASTGQQTIGQGHMGTFSQSLKVQAPKLWSVTKPYLYRLTVQVLQGGKVTDVQTVKTGIRSIKFVPGGFYLNNEKVTISGTNRHQEYPYIGYALSDNAQYRDAWKIKNAGFNFVRCSHYPPSPAFLDACDELGILVMDAIPGWQFFGGPAFQVNSLQNIQDMIHRDRNHPSIVLWESSLNETGMSKEYMDKAHKLTHQELPFADTYSSGWIDYAYDVVNPARQHAKAPDYWKKYDHPKPLLIAEYGDWEYYAQNAGFNQKAYEGLQKEERNSRQLRTDGQQRLLQQALNFQEAHNDDLYGPAVGDANWLMFDYKRGYAPDIESSGIMDIYRLPKFSFYFYQSQYGPVPDANGMGKPMLFIANYWNDSKQKTVKIYSNCQQVELLVNGHSVGKQKPDQDAMANNLIHPPFTFNLNSYEAGELKAVGYINGKVAITESRKTPGKPYKIVVEADRSGKDWKANTNDALFFYAYVTDKQGTPIPNANNLIEFTVSNGAQLVGNSSVTAEAGIATALIKAGSKPTTVKIMAAAQGLKPATLNYAIK